MRVLPGPGFRWGIIVRRSKYNKDGTEGSTHRQKMAVQGRIKAEDMGVVVMVYPDIASAYDAKAKRPGLEQALYDLQRGFIDGIAVWKIDRLVRRTSQYQEVVSVLRESGGRLYSMVEGIDTAAEGQQKAITNIVLSILVSLAEMESENTSIRMGLMLDERAQRGLPHTGRFRTYGYSKDGLEVVWSEGLMIREAANRYLSGESWREIARDWNARGIETVTGTPWLATTIRDMLRSLRLISKQERNGTVYDLKIEPILEEGTWQKVQDKLAENLRGGIGPQYFLTGYAECECGTTVLANKQAARLGGQRLYACRPVNGREGACGSMSALAAPVDELVTARVLAFLQERDRVETLLAQVSPAPEVASMRARLKELAEDEWVIEKSYLNPTAGKRRISEERLNQALDEIEDERDDLLRRLAVNREASRLAEVLSFDDVTAEWEERPMEWRRAIVQLVCERIVIERRGRGQWSGKGFSNAFDPDRVKIDMAA